MFMSAAGVAVAVAVGIAGCGEAQKLSAKDQVATALTNFDKSKSATFTLKLDTTAADLEAINKVLEGRAATVGEKKVYALLTSSDVVISTVAPAGKTFGEASKAQPAQSQDYMSLLNDPAKLKAALKASGSMSFAVRQGGGALFEVRFLDGLFYSRADVKKIFTLADQDYSTVEQQLGSLPIAMAPIADAAKGKWISLDLAAAAATAKKSGLLEAIPSPSAVPSVDAAKMQHLMTSLKTAYNQKATITKIGESDRGTDYRLSAPAKQVAQAVQTDLIALVGKEAGQSIRKGIADLPDKTFSLDVWIKDDQVTGVSLDLIQFLKKPVPGKKLALDITVATNKATVTAPTGVSALDLDAVLSQLPPGALAGLTGGASTGGASASGSDAKKAGPAEISDEQIEEMKKQTGMSEKEIRDLLGK